MTPQEVIKELQRTKSRIRDEFRRANRETVKAGLLMAKELSRGPYTTTQLRRMGHPYSSRNPRPPADPGIINRQSREFEQEWKSAAGTTWYDNVLYGKIYNHGKVAEYLRAGTTRMIARPLDKLLLKKLIPLRKQAFKDAMRRALKP